MRVSPLVRFAQHMHAWPSQNRWWGPLLATAGVLIAGLQPSYLLLACGTMLVPPQNWASMLVFSGCLHGILSPKHASVALWEYGVVSLASFLHFFLTQKIDRVQPHDNSAQMH